MRKSVHTPEYALLRAELRNQRRHAGLSQRALAAKLRVPHSWIAKVEAGERRLDFVELCWFLRACGTDPAATCERLALAISTSRPRTIAKKEHQE
jgi:transcriptional regulator with XRE-family HTH domain